MYAFLVRLYYLEEEGYKAAKEVLKQRGLCVMALSDYYYGQYKYAFCRTPAEREVPNVHEFSHMWMDREKNGPIHHHSAEVFESVYAPLRYMFRAGTTNTPKQVLENFWMRER